MSGRVGSITTEIITDGLVFNIDAANRASYPQTGTTATDTINSLSGTLIGTVFSNSNNGVFDFDGTDDYIDFDDSNNLSFGNSSTDSPFSIFQWWNMDSYQDFRGVQKFANSGTDGEYRLNTINSGILKFSLFDSNMSKQIGIKTSSDLSSHQSTWINIVGTYSGNSSSSGLKLYLNGSILSTSSDDAGSYTAMHNSSHPFKLGRLTTGYANGKIANTYIYNRALSSTEVLHNYNALKGRFSLS